jgi:hypothetical protein
MRFPPVSRSHPGCWEFEFRTITMLRKGRSLRGANFGNEGYQRHAQITRPKAVGKAENIVYVYDS